jgi:hypothetical protein
MCNASLLRPEARRKLRENERFRVRQFIDSIFQHIMVLLTFLRARGDPPSPSGSVHSLSGYSSSALQAATLSAIFVNQ